jgi:hypothetical protein
MSSNLRLSLQIAARVTIYDVWLDELGIEVGKYRNGYT